ncbi:phage tail assembly protein T [Burkholderia pseudomallei]|uniref:phage tail assembly protein T n=1 Tax=Burkholderia pseudomallei TaxID=28450 RepID=UPI0012F497F7|nr:hypothetical protein [Burkholderia pseudomallei]
MLANLDSTELTEWLAFDHMEPIGEHRADLRAGIVAATIGGGRPLDYMPFQQAKPEGPTLLPDPDAQAELILGAFGNCQIIRKAA